MKVQSRCGFRGHFYAMDLAFSPLGICPIITGLMDCLLFTVSLLRMVGQSLNKFVVLWYLAPLCGFMLKERNSYGNLFWTYELVIWGLFLPGDVYYRSKFLRSDTYMKNITANRIVVSEFGTMTYPDPCKNIFSK